MTTGRRAGATTGRRAAVRRAGTTSDGLPLLGVGTGLVATVAAGWLAGFRLAGVVLAAVLVVVALARWLLPVAAVGPLAVRSKRTDVATAGALAAGLLTLALTAPPGGP